ncbi:acyl-[acyl-carrier-protein] thioesterase [Lachnoclostridium sp. Marseille-P6806]|uniref:acyl-[acyl-carrier-protein] thioesterase n=1 Tax=Lachnoclostridium sp. Marseille-P6806 TaxID=2364793 RepID=UPI00102FF8D4|nr:acyl-ACP thioesterase domain-containing protein [Lachnoclostridium sp. Marseille-P6806]
MYGFDGRVRYSEVDGGGLLRPDMLINYFQDCSTFQSEDGGVGIRYMLGQGAAWIVNYWQIDIRRYPALGERVVVGTSPYELRGFLGLRNFVMDTPEGERLAIANSVWSLLDLNRLVPVRATQKMVEVFELHDKLDMEYLPRKIAVPKQGGELLDSIVVDRGHIDSNRHVNNGQYVRFAVERIPPEELVTGLRVEYRRQAFIGDTMQFVQYVREPERSGDPGIRTITMGTPDGALYAAAELRVRRRTEREQDAWL